jgi:RNA polymerase sigma factor (sigma-70 family)
MEGLILLDIERIRRVQDGEVELFEGFINIYKKQVYLFVFNMVKSTIYKNDVEDFVQETFYRAYKNLHTFKGDYKFNTWLLTIARNIVITEFRKKRELPVDCTILDKSSVVSAESIVISNTTNNLLISLLDKLPEKQKTVICLKVFDGLSYEDIAKKLNKTESSIKSLIFRARETLRNSGGVEYV